MVWGLKVESKAACVQRKFSSGNNLALWASGLVFVVEGLTMGHSDPCLCGVQLSWISLLESNTGELLLLPLQLLVVFVTTVLP